MIRLGICALFVMAACSAPDAVGNEAARSGEVPVTEANTSGPEASTDERAPAEQEPLSRQPREEPPSTAPSQGCNAGKYEYLVGQHRSKIPPKPAGATWRIACTGCPVTMDYSERRLNIFYNERSGIIEEVKCG